MYYVFIFYIRHSLKILSWPPLLVGAYGERICRIIQYFKKIFKKIKRVLYTWPQELSKSSRLKEIPVMFSPLHRSASNSLFALFYLNQAAIKGQPPLCSEACQGYIFLSSFYAHNKCSLIYIHFIVW